MKTKKHFLRKPIFWVGVSLLLLASIPTAYLIYGYQSKRAFEKHLENLIRAGESLEIDDHVPATVDDASQDFAEAPIVRRLCGLESHPSSNTNEPRLGIELPDHREMDGYEMGTAQTVRYHRSKPLNDDFPTLSEKEAAEAYITKCKPVEDILSDLAEASSRPSSNFELEYDLGFALTMPELTKLQSAARVFNRRAQSFLVNNEIERSADDICTLINLSRHVSSESSVIHQLVSITLLDMAITRIHQGLGNQRWSVPHLQRFDEHLQSITIAEGFLRGFRMERAVFASLLLDRSRRQDVLHASGYGNLAPYIFVIPEGWYYDNVRRYSEIFQEGLLTDSAGNPLMDTLPTEGVKKSVSSISTRPAIDQIRYGLTSITLPAFNSILTRFQRIQTLVDHARIVLALEGERIANGTYPEALVAVDENFNGDPPIDMFTGLPYIYRLQQDGTFILYGVGSNCIDYGGLLKYSNDHGDWVWRSNLPEDFDYDEYRSRD